MIDLEISRYGYVELNTSDYLAALGDLDETLTEQFNTWYAADDTLCPWVDDNVIGAWLETLRDPDDQWDIVTGLYDEPGAWHLGSTYNHETNLSTDIILTVAHVGGHDLLIVHGHGFSYEHSYIGNGLTGVYVLNNGDDYDVVGLWDRAYLTHSEPDRATAETLTGEIVSTGCDWSATLEDSRWSVDVYDADYPGSDPATIFGLAGLEWNDDADTFNCPNCGDPLAAYTVTS